MFTSSRRLSKVSRIFKKYYVRKFHGGVDIRTNGILGHRIFFRSTTPPNLVILDRYRILHWSRWGTPEQLKLAEWIDLGGICGLIRHHLIVNMTSFYYLVRWHHSSWARVPFRYLIGDKFKLEWNEDWWQNKCTVEINFLTTKILLLIRISKKHLYKCPSSYVKDLYIIPHRLKFWYIQYAYAYTHL